VSITAAKLQAEVGADTKGFDAGMKHADQTVAAAPSKWGKALKVGGGLALGIGAAVIVKSVTGAIGAGLTSLRAQGVVVAQTNAVIKSTGSAAHVTSAQIRDLSNAIEDKTAIDDKQIQSAANMLLTFTNVRNEAGKGNDIFTQAVGVLADMSTAMGTDAKSGAIQLGKALNDPVKGITALTRVGVTFDAQQKKRIEQFVKEGKVAEAQKIILRELNKEFGGSGAAFAASDAGQAAKFQDAIEGIDQSIAKGLLPTITAVRGQLTHFLNDPATLGQAEALGNAIASIFTESNLRTAANLMTTAAGAVSTAVKLFASLPPEVQALAVGAIALKKITGIGPLDIAKGAGGLLKIAFQKGETPANPLYVADVSGGLGGGASTGGGSKLGKVVGAVGKVFLVGAAIGVFAELKGILDEQSAANKQQEAGLTGQTTGFAGSATLEQMKTSLAGILAYDKELTNSFSAEGAAFQFNIDGVRDSVRAQEQTLKNAIQRAEGQLAASNVHVTERAESIASHKADAIRNAANATALAVRRSEAAGSRHSAATNTKLAILSGDTRSEKAGIIAAIRSQKTHWTLIAPQPVPFTVLLNGQRVAAGGLRYVPGRII
jgi:hypothetical protein